MSHAIALLSLLGVGTILALAVHKDKVKRAIEKKKDQIWKRIAGDTEPVADAHATAPKVHGTPPADGTKPPGETPPDDPHHKEGKKETLFSQFIDGLKSLFWLWVAILLIVIVGIPWLKKWSNKYTNPETTITVHYAPGNSQPTQAQQSGNNIVTLSPGVISRTIEAKTDHFSCHVTDTSHVDIHFVLPNGERKQLLNISESEHVEGIVLPPGTQITWFCKHKAQIHIDQF